ncbi:MAG: hypothetical protein JNL32_00055 [Candidatus Kapabacteria bacterium]|nr:hypothetical protein [Candidatus Kapabacteria bacterium]
MKTTHKATKPPQRQKYLLSPLDVSRLLPGLSHHITRKLMETGDIVSFYCGTHLKTTTDAVEAFKVQLSAGKVSLPGFIEPVRRRK